MAPQVDSIKTRNLSHCLQYLPSDQSLVSIDQTRPDHTRPDSQLADLSSPIWVPCLRRLIVDLDGKWNLKNLINQRGQIID